MGLILNVPTPLATPGRRGAGLAADTQRTIQKALERPAVSRNLARQQAATAAARIAARTPAPRKISINWIPFFIGMGLLGIFVVGGIFADIAGLKDWSKLLQDFAKLTFGGVAGIIFGDAVKG